MVSTNESNPHQPEREPKSQRRSSLWKSVVTFPVAAAGVVGLVIVAMQWTLVSMLYEYRADTFSSTLQLVAEACADEIEAEVRERVLAIERMRARWSFASPVSVDLWRADAQQYLEHFPALQGLCWVDEQMRVTASVGTSIEGLGFSSDTERDRVTGSLRERVFERGGAHLLVAQAKGSNRSLVIIGSGASDSNHDTPALVAVFDANSLLKAPLAANLNAGFHIDLIESGASLLGNDRSAPIHRLPPHRVARVHTSLMGRPVELVLGDSPVLHRMMWSPLPEVVLAASICLTILLALLALLLFRFVMNARRLRAANAALQESEERFDRAVRGTSDGLWEWHIPEGRHWHAPRYHELLGYSQDDPEADPYFDFSQHVHPADFVRLVEEAERHLRDGTPFDLEVRIRTKLGEYSWFRVRGQATPSPTGEPTHMSGSIQDINERKAFEHALELKTIELERSNAELEQFAFVASHDLQEPLRKVRLFGDRLRHKLDGSVPREGEEYLDRMIGAMDRMERLLTDLLDFSRVGTRGEAFKPVDLNGLLAEVRGDLEVLIQETGAAIEVGHLPTVVGDRTQLGRLFQNLLQNALRYRHPDRVPRIRVSSSGPMDRGEGEYCCIDVSDNGRGFAQDHAEKAFLPFTRLHTTVVEKGSGMGLAMCKKIVARHGGTIRVESTEQKGTVFTVNLPLFN